jgi:uncharacterized protein (DUF58 family)
VWWSGREAPAGSPANATELDAAALVRQARRLRFRVRPDAVSLLSGAYHSARPGTGLTFQELRPYEPGDDVRHIDWNVSARQDRPYVRHYVEERQLTLALVVDLSASMRFGPAGQTKADRAAQAAALLAAAAVQNGDRVGLRIIGSTGDSELAPEPGTRHLARVLRMLVAAPAGSGRGRLGEALENPMLRGRRGLVVLLSDFLEPEPVAAWRRVGRTHDVLALRLFDAREEHLPAAGLLDLAAAESDARRVVDSGSRRVRAAYAHAARLRRSGFEAWCATARFTPEHLPSGDDPLTHLLRIFRARARRPGGRS